MSQSYPGSFLDFVAGLYAAESFENAFKLFEEHVQVLGFEGVLYTYIPRIMLDSNLPVTPVFAVSNDYCPAYLDHYTEARFDQLDPMIRAVSDGVMTPIDWWGDICADYISRDPASRSVLATAEHYGIRNGVTLPLMSGARGIAGASFISYEQQGFDVLLEERVRQLKLSARIFHSMVVSDSGHAGHFAKPLLQSLSETEKQFVFGLARGQTVKELSVDLRRSTKYLEQVMISVRKKLSDNSGQGNRIINRNQLLYYAGLLNILE